MAGTVDKKSDDPGSLKVKVEDLQPFTHVTYIPVGSDLNSIRFENVKVVAIPTQVRTTMDPHYCDQLIYRDPGGSMFCPSSQFETPATAYKVTYSYRGAPLASDEYASDHFNFDVYFQPNELAPEVRKAVAEGNLNRADMAGYFTVKTSSLTRQALVMDPSQSRLCDRVLMDGVPTPASKSCQDQTQYKTVTTASDYVAVRVDPVSAR